MTEQEKRDLGLWYDANYDPSILQEREHADMLCFQLNNTPPNQTQKRQELLRTLMPNLGQSAVILSPFYTDYGYHCTIGEDSFLNHGAHLMDCAPITIGSHCFIGPNCGMYTAIHPLLPDERNQGLECAKPITLGDNVWLGGDVNFEVRDGTTFTLLQLLLDGIIDVSVARTPLRLENVEYMQLSTEPMIAAFPPDSRVEKEGVLGLRHLLGRPLILYRRYERLILEEFSRQNIHPDVFCVCDDARDAMLWVKAGLATAIFPQSMHSLCTGLRIQPLEETALETQTVLIWKKGGPLSPVVQDFLQVCQAHH